MWHLVQCWIFLKSCPYGEGTLLCYRNMKQCTCSITGSATEGWIRPHCRAVGPQETSIPTVKTFSTPWPRTVSLKDRKSKTLKTFCLGENQSWTGMSGSHLTDCNFYEKQSISRDFLHSVPQQIVPKEGTYSISASCLLFETNAYGNMEMEANF